MYIPGSNPRALEKARTLDADVLILDLEDAVAPEAKEDARRTVVEVVSARPYGGREVLVRINGLDTPWGEDDLKAVAALPADGIVLPKVNSESDVHRVEAALPAAAPALWCMMETPLGVLQALSIARSSARLCGLIMGTSDLAKDLRAAHTPDREPFLTALGLCLLAARATGLAILDGVHLDLQDDDGFHQSCLQGARLGFDGKTLIHPRTIATANACFSPSAEDVDRARIIVDAFENARKEGKGVVVVDGRLVEALHVEEAVRLLALNDAIAARKPA
nr:CoA ester lyase [Phaeovibrio sulfidiphilus]